MLRDACVSLSFPRGHEWPPLSGMSGALSLPHPPVALASPSPPGPQFPHVEGEEPGHSLGSPQLSLPAITKLVSKLAVCLHFNFFQ